MYRHKILIDISHMSERAVQATFDIVERLDAEAGREGSLYPIIAGHVGMRSVSAATRAQEYNLSDEIAVKIAERIHMSLDVKGHHLPKFPVPPGKDLAGYFEEVVRVGELFVRNEPSLARGGEPKALVEAHEMRRGIDVHAQPRRLQDRAHESDGGTLAVGAGDMDCRRQPPLGMTERGEDAPHSIERQIDPFRMQRREPRDGGLDGGHVFVISTRPPLERRVAPAHAAREPKDARQPAAGSGNVSTGGFGRALVNSLHRFASVGRRSVRLTTMSTMPWSLKYSAR